jgi:hypothetical protein
MYSEHKFTPPACPSLGPSPSHHLSSCHHDLFHFVLVPHSFLCHHHQTSHLCLIQKQDLSLWRLLLLALAYSLDPTIPGMLALLESLGGFSSRQPL